eukprot:1378306-Amorphochlora_amoeboformis.AAC.3
MPTLPGICGVCATHSSLRSVEHLLDLEILDLWAPFVRSPHPLDLWSLIHEICRASSVGPVEPHLLDLWKLVS